MMQQLIKFLRFPTVLLPILLMTVCLSSAEEKEALEVARVGATKITAKQLHQYIAERSAEGKENAVEQGRDYLRTMIDMELLLLEAQSGDIDKSLSYIKKTNKNRRAKLVRTYQQRELKLAEIEESEIVEYVREKGFARAVRLADILLADRVQAEAVVKAIREGEDFAQVAKRLSINKKTAAKGGDMGYTTRDQMIPILQDKLYSLRVGQITEPIELNDRFAIFKILDEAPIELNPQQRMKIANEFKRMKFRDANTALVAELRVKFRLEIDRNGFDSLVEKLNRDESITTEDERNITLYRYDNGVITTGDFVDLAGDLKGNPLASITDREQAISFAERNVVANIMVMEAALHDGIDREREIAAWLEDQRRQLLIGEIRQAVLKARVSLTDDEVRKFYDDHPNKYMHPEHIEIQEILVETKAEALRLQEEIKAGSEFGDLARQHSIRSKDHRDEEGRFHIHLYEKLQFGGLVEAVAVAEIGALTGPVAVDEGFSIFKPLSKGRKRESFAEANWRVRSHVKKIKDRQAFNSYMEELRDKYRSDIHILEDQLNVALGNG